jgi:DNA-binding XRE family transcriptional regulator
MTGRRPISDLTKNWSSARIAAVEAEQRTLETEAATLEEVRVALGVSQEKLAELLDVQQPAVSKLERRNDMRVSTLREVIEALGGELRLVAKFRDRSIDLSIVSGG